MVPKSVLVRIVPCIVLTGFLLAGCGDRPSVAEDAPSEVTAFGAVSNLITYTPTAPIPAGFSWETAGRRVVGDLNTPAEIDPIPFERSGIRLILGERLTVMGRAVPGTIAGRPANLMPIVNEAGDRIWASTRFVIPDSRGAVVVTADCDIYATPTFGRPTGATLPRGTVVAASPKVINRFVEVATWDEVNNIPYDGIYLSLRDISFDEGDVTVASGLFRASIAVGDEATAILAEIGDISTPNFADDLSEGRLLQ